MKRIVILVISAVLVMSCLATGPASVTPAAPATVVANTNLPSSTPEPTDLPEPTNTPMPTKTQAPTYTPTPDVFALVEDQIKSYKSSELSTIFTEFTESGSYTLDDLSYTGARQYTLFPKYLDFQPEEFILLSKVKWEHSSAKITASAASCGFMFRNNDTDKSYFAVISADGNTRLINIHDDRWDGVAHQKIRSQTFNAQTDEVDMLLAVLPDRFVMAVDGEIILDQALTWDSTGYFGYSLISGTNRDYGTRCSFSDTIIFVNKESSITQTSGG